MTKHTFIAMVQIETDDPDLASKARERLLSSGNAEVFAEVRRRVLSHLPHDVTRLVAVLPVEHARMLMHLHEVLGGDLGADAFVRPPADYRKPEDQS